MRPKHIVTELVRLADHIDKADEPSISFVSKQVRRILAVLDLTGEFAAPPEQVLAVITKTIGAEFQTHYAYKVYAQALRDLSHDSIAEHFEEHAEDEMEHADFLLKRSASLGGFINAPPIPPPQLLTDPVQIIKTMIQLEIDGVNFWKEMLAVVGNNNPMYITIEEYMAKEQEHYDELVQLLPA
jgi:bacterioferritin